MRLLHTLNDRKNLCHRLKQKPAPYRVPSVPAAQQVVCSKCEQSVRATKRSISFARLYNAAGFSRLKKNANIQENLECSRSNYAIWLRYEFAKLILALYLYVMMPGSKQAFYV